MTVKSAFVVDNDVVFLNVITDILTHEGYRVRTARDGREALAGILQSPPDVLFTDLIMPKISGEQLIAYIRDCENLRHMTIVVISAAIIEYAGHERISADYFIVKSDIHTFRRQLQKIAGDIFCGLSSEREQADPNLTLRSRKIVEELLNSRQNILQILENMRAGLLVYDDDLRILSANPAAEILIGKPASLILGTPVEDHMEVSYWTLLQALMKPSGDIPVFRDMKICIRDRVLDLNISHLWNPMDGSWKGGLILMHDVTRIERLHRYLEAAARVASMLLKRENVHGQVKAVLEILGRASGASRSYWYRNSQDASGNIGMSLKAEWCAEGIFSRHIANDSRRQYYHNGLSRWYQELAADRIISGSIHDFPLSEQEILRNFSICSMALIPLLVRGKFEGFIGFDNCSEDIPWKNPEVNLLRLATDSLAKAFEYDASLIEKHYLQNQLLHSQRMKFMGEISAGIAHNFRNILSGVMGNAELINLKYPDVEGIQKYTSGIISIAKSGSDMIAGLMKFSRMESKGSKRIFNLSDVLEECYQIISTSFRKQIVIRKKWPALLLLEGEPSELTQVFMNLFTNAQDAMPEGGTLQIEAAISDQRVIVRVSDTGCGMTEETTRKIFDPFFTTKDAGKGTGLGLSTAYGIVHNHDGNIQVMSQPGLGTVFTLSFPVPEAPLQQGQEDDGVLIHGHGEKVLIVDDDESIFEVLRNLLETYGYRVVTVKSGRDAIDIYPKCRPDVILLDRNMPDMDGIATARQLLALNPAVRIIIASGYEADGPNGIPRYLQDTIKGYIVKPCEIAGLLKLLNEVLVQ